MMPISSLGCDPGRRDPARARRIKILREYERAVVFFLGRFRRVKGPGLIVIIPGIQQMVRVDLRTRRLRRAAAGRDHARQRLGEGERGGVLPRRRPAAGDHPGGELPRGHQPARADHAARGARQARARRAALRARDSSTRDIQKVLDAQTDAWGIKVSNVEIKHVDLNETDGARHRAPGRGRARAPRQGDPRRGRAAGLREAAAGGADALAAAPRRCSCATCRR